MIWIYLIVIIVIGLIVGLLSHRLIKRKNYSYGITLLAVIIALIITYVYATPYYLASQLENTLKSQNPFLSLIAEESPQEFNAYVAKLKNNMLTKGEPSNEVYYAAQLVNSLLIKYGPTASNESLYQYLKSDIAFDKKLFAIDPVLVLFQEFPNKFADKIDLKKYNDDALKNNIMADVEKVVVSGIKNPHPLPNPQDIAEAEGMFRGILTELGKKYGEETVTMALQHPEDPSVDKAKAANIVIDISEAILAKGEEAVGLLLRSSFLISKTNAGKAK